MLKSCFTSIWLAIVAVALIVLNQFVFDLPDEPKPAGRFFDAGGGVRMHYVERPGKDPAIVYLHGLPGTHHDFDLVAERLEGRHLVAIDRPGFGDSTGGTQDMFAQADSVHRLLASRGVTRATVVGHSYGGPLAFALAHEHPRDVGRIVTIAAAAGGNRLRGMQQFNRAMIGFLHLPVVEQVNELFVSNMLLRGTAELQVRSAFSPEEPVSPFKRNTLTYTLKDGDLEALRENAGDYNADITRVDGFLDEIRRPAVIVHGWGDKLVDPKRAGVIARAMPDAKLVMLQGGHMLGYTQPAEIAKQIRAVERR